METPPSHEDELSSMPRGQQHPAQHQDSPPKSSAARNGRRSPSFCSHSAAAGDGCPSPPPHCPTAFAVDTKLSVPAHITGVVAECAAAQAARTSDTQVAATETPKALLLENEDFMQLDEARRKLLQEKRSKQLHWGSSLQVYTPVHIWINTYQLSPAALGPGFHPGKMVNSRGLVLSTYKWTHPNLSDVRGAIILYHSYTSHALWDFLRHQPLKPQEQSHRAPGLQQLESRCEHGAEGAVVPSGAPPPASTEEDLRRWVPQYAGSWVEALYTERFNVYALDHQSHGHSEGWQGWRCNVQDFFCFVEDSLQFLSEVVACDPCTPAAAPIYLLGYSMGGNIALQTLGALFSPLTAAAYRTAATDAAAAFLSSQPHSNTAATGVKAPAVAASSNASPAHDLATNTAVPAADHIASASASTKRRVVSEHQQDVSRLLGERVKAVVLLAPLIKILVDRKTEILSKINLHLLSCCLPNLRLVSSAGGAGYEYLDWWYEKDLFAYAGRAKSRMIANLFRAAQRVQKSIKYLPPQLKVLCLQGTRDMTVDFRGPLALTQSKAKVDLIYLTGWSHYLAKEKGSELLIDLVVTWLRVKLQVDAASSSAREERGCGYPHDDSNAGVRQPPVVFEFSRNTKFQQGTVETRPDRKARVYVDAATQTEEQ